MQAVYVYGGAMLFTEFMSEMKETPRLLGENDLRTRLHLPHLHDLRPFPLRLPKTLHYLVSPGEHSIARESRFPLYQGGETKSRDEE
jgi:hypothetical protein